nr:MAG TPA: hypothetical protein [Caudoviricetes sp.]
MLLLLPYSYHFTVVQIYYFCTTKSQDCTTIFDFIQYFFLLFADNQMYVILQNLC